MGEKTHWQREQLLLKRLLEAPEQNRAQLLRDSCEQTEVRKSVENLLAAWSNSESFLESPAASRNSNGEHGSLQPGQMLGAYEVRSLLGHGGMGSVYLGQRTDGSFERNVAIKVLNPGVQSKDSIQRFQSEAKILAGLDHPNIARLYDGGSTPSGDPYFVMECVDGVPIDQYVANLMSVSDTVRLFQKVCVAVDHAHRNLIVHRDIKPANILVTPEREPKLLDFGIAKLLEPNDKDQTQTSFHPMTLRYSSPEQRNGRPITTASDVYSLGILLYKLLTGDTPSLDGSLADNTTSTPPSDAYKERLNSPDTELGKFAETRHRAIKGDLDNIVMMALRIDPDQRYGSVNALSEDLGRYLTGMPVKARPVTFWYVLRKFVRRNTLAVSSLSALVVMLSIFAVSTVLQNRRILIERDKAHTISEFLVNLFENADPDQSKGGDLTVREVLDQGAQRLTTELDNQPEVQAALQHTIGKVYFTLGEYDKSSETLKRSLTKRRKLSSDSAADLSNTLEMLAVTHQFKGEFEQAEDLYKECLEIRQRILDPFDEDVASVTMNIGTLFLFQKRHAEAQPYLEKALAIVQATLDPNNPNIAHCMDALAGNYHYQGESQLAKHYYEQSLIIRTKLHGKQNSSVAFSLNNLGLVHSNSDPAKATDYFLQALSIYENTIGWDHPYTARTLSRLAEVKQVQGHFESAAPLLDQVVQIVERSFGIDHEYLADAIHEQAINEHSLGHYGRALELFDRALEIRARINMQIKADQTKLAWAKTLFCWGDVERAESVLCELYEHRWTLTDANIWPQISIALAELYLSQNRLLECDSTLNAMQTQVPALALQLSQEWHFLKGRLAQSRGDSQFATRQWEIVASRLPTDRPLSIQEIALGAKVHFLLGHSQQAKALIPQLKQSGLSDPDLNQLYVSLDATRQPGSN